MHRWPVFQLIRPGGVRKNREAARADAPARGNHHRICPNNAGLGSRDVDEKGADVEGGGDQGEREKLGRELVPPLSPPWTNKGVALPVASGRTVYGE